MIELPQRPTVTDEARDEMLCGTRHSIGARGRPVEVVILPLLPAHTGHSRRRPEARNPSRRSPVPLSDKASRARCGRSLIRDVMVGRIPLKTQETRTLVNALTLIHLLDQLVGSKDGRIIQRKGILAQTLPRLHDRDPKVARRARRAHLLTCPRRAPSPLCLWSC